MDFKTSRPHSGESWDDFLIKEQERYRLQLEAYREMTGRLKGISPPQSIRLALYFTACQKVVEL